MMQPRASTGAGPKCQACGRPLKDDRYKLCYDCAQKQRSGGTGPPSAARPQLPDTYLKGGYFDDNGYLKAELVTEHANRVAKTLADAGVTTGQIRRFFTMARSIEQRLDATGDFAAVVPEVASLQPFAASVIGREQNEQTRRNLEVFRQFIERNSALAQKDEKSFRKGFLPHFQYVVAYFTLYKPK